MWNKLPAVGKHNLSLRSPICLVLLLLISAYVAADDRPTLILNDVNEPPFTTPQKDGFLDVIASEAFRRAGANLELVKLPAERGLINANTGIEDGELSRIAGLEKLYPNLIRMPEKIVDWEFVAFSKNPQIAANWPVIRQHTVGVIIGWKIYERQLTGATNVVSVNGPSQLFKLLAIDRIEIALYSRWTGAAYIKKHGLKGIYQLKPTLAKKEMFIYLHKRHANFVPRLAKALRALKQEGYYQRMQQEKLSIYSRPVLR